KKTMDATIDQLLDFGITREELQNSKTQLESNMMIRLESTSSRMSRNGRNELLLQKHQTMDEAAKNIEIVTEEEINQLMKTILETETAIAMIRPLSLQFIECEGRVHMRYQDISGKEIIDI